MKEADWKLLKSISAIALDRISRRALDEVAAIVGDESRGNHQRYLDIQSLIRQREQDIARAFNDQRRSNALYCLIALHSLGLLTEEEYLQFSMETRESVDYLLELPKRKRKPG